MNEASLTGRTEGGRMCNKSVSARNRPRNARKSGTSDMRNRNESSLNDTLHLWGNEHGKVHGHLPAG